MELKKRTGERPQTRPTTPHQQLSQIAPVALQEELWRRMEALNDITTGRSGISLPDTRALHLAPSRTAGPPEAFLIGTEFAHLHGAPDGSLHLTLPEPIAQHAIDQGCAELHPMARCGLMPSTLVMVYGPRDQDEVEQVWELVQISHGFATAAH